MKQFDFRIIGLLVLISLTAGSLFANIYCSDNVSELGAFNYEFIEKMQGMKIEQGKLFQYVLMERLKVWGLFFLLAFTCIRVPVYFGYIISFGFMLGLTGSAMVMVHGFKGTFYFAFLCLIAQLIYFAAVLLGMSVGMGCSRAGKRRASGSSGTNSVLGVLASLILLCISAFTETIFHIYFIKWIC